MRAVNGSLQALSALSKAGWRAVPLPTAPTPAPLGPAAANSTSRAPSLKSSASSASLSSANKDAASRTKAEEACTACSSALATLRQLASQGQINNRVTDVEKGAGSLVASLVELGLYIHALRELVLMRASILSWYTSNPVPPIPLLEALSKSLPPKATRPPPSPLVFSPVLAVPLPPSPFFDPPTLVEAVSSTCRPAPQDVIPLVLLVQQYALGCLFRAPLSPSDLARRPATVAAFLGGESAEGTPVQWRKTLDSLVEDNTVLEADAEVALKKADAMMASMFGTITKGCVDADTVATPESLLAVRSQALLAFATTRSLVATPEKLDAFLDQTRKVLLLYGRQAEKLSMSLQVVGEAVVRIFDLVLVELKKKDAAREGKAWIALCEVVIHIARRAGDTSTVERVSLLISASTSQNANPELQVAESCAKIAAAHCVLTTFFKSSEDKGVVDQVTRALLVIPVLSRLRTERLLPPESFAKIDKTLDRIQYATICHVRAGKRADQQYIREGEERSPRTPVEQKLLDLLNALAEHVEIVNRTFSATPPPPPAMLVGRTLLYQDAIEVLVLLAYARLSIDDRQTYHPAFASLERCLPLLSATFSRDKKVVTSIAYEAHYSLRTVASAYYNIGGALFNASKPEAAIRFAMHACEISQAAVDGWSKREEGAEEAEDVAAAMEDLRNHVAKRYELLALANQAIGNKESRELALEAYTSAILTQPPATLLALESALRTLPVAALLSREHAGLFRTVQRATKLAAFDLRLDASRVSLRDRLRDAGHSSATTAAVLELQLAAMETSLDREESAPIVATLLEALLQLYTPAQNPMRRARTLVRRMQHQCTPARIPLDMSAAAAAAEIETLCTQDSNGDDTGLKAFSSQYLAMSHLWLAFHAHQARQDGASDATHTEARQALRILRAALDANIPPSPSAPKRSPAKAASPKEKPITRRRTPAPPLAAKTPFKTPQVSRTLAGRPKIATVDLVTPPSSRGALDHASPRKGDVEALVLDDAEKCFATIESMTNLLGALGYTLLRISYLKFLRRLAAKLGAKAPGAFVTMSAHLGDEYTRLGKTSRAGLIFSQADHRIQQMLKTGAPIPEAAHITYLTLYAGYLAVIGTHDRSTTAYSEALTIAESYNVDEAGLPTTLKIVERTLRLQRAASASTVCSTMLQRRPAMQACRLWQRALNNISRLAVAPAPSQDSALSSSRDAFTSSGPTDPKAPLPDFPTEPTKRSQPARVQWPNTGLAWLLADGLARSMLRIATLHSIRGTPKAAEYFAEQALSFAKDLGSSRLSARALGVRTEVRLHAGKFDEAKEDLEKISAILGPTSSSPEAIEARRLRADLHMRLLSVQEAHQGYLEAQKELDAYADEFKLLAGIQFHDLLIRFASDPVLEMLPESVLSIPTLSVPSSTKAVVSPRHGPSLLNGLREIENLLSRAMNFSVSRSQPGKLRELSLLTAAHHLGLAVTLRREMLDAIDFKLAGNATHDDLTWPPLEVITPAGEDLESVEASKQYWASIRERYRIESAEASMTDVGFSTLLPTAWTVISLHLTVECDCLLLVRHRRDAEPLIFKLPLDRVARREANDEDGGLTFDMALGELQNIIAASNAGTRRAKDVVGKEERATWWAERKSLDARLEALTKGLEDAWLGAFKSVFLDARNLDPAAAATFRSQVERILKRSITRSHEKKSARFKLDDDILACLAALPPTAEHDDIEDLFYFIMESFQFTGVPVAYDEIDVDQVAVDLRTALEELHAAQRAVPSEDEHTFLLLDKSLQGFPWESIPCLQGRSVSRLPSLAFLRDRLDLARLRATSPDRPHELIVDSSKTAYLLNPSGDLKNTQATFESWLDGQKSKGWSGIVGRAPSDLEMIATLSTKEVFLYFGHGGAEQYVRSQSIRHLPRCAVTMLWGCSSGLLKDLGDYDPVGTPYHYMIAGCPTLLANLWDVTDKDIDKLAEAVFRKTGLGQDDTFAGPRATLTQAVATSRDSCNLRWLNAASTVVYGIPVRFG
ncbi:hypothetical protein RQP46_006951 [Phenoliferia psychrophenolica]